MLLRPLVLAMVPGNICHMIRYLWELSSFKFGMVADERFKTNACHFTMNRNVSGIHALNLYSYLTLKIYCLV